MTSHFEKKSPTIWDNDELEQKLHLAQKMKTFWKN